jgi:hypothetical protein
MEDEYKTTFARTDPFERWYEALRQFSGGFSHGMTGFRNSETGNPEAVLFTGTVDQPADRSSVVVLQLSSVAAHADSSDASVKSIGQSGGITAHSVSIVNTIGLQPKNHNESVGPKGAEPPDLVKWFLWIKETSRLHPYWATLAILAIVGTFLISPTAHSVFNWLSGIRNPVDVPLNMEEACELRRAAWSPENKHPDYVEAMRLFRICADLGNARAMAQVGWIYEGGYGVVTRSYPDAMQWYEKASDRGDAIANWNIGRLYEQSCGVKRDIPAARGWYGKARDQGIAEGTRELSRLDAGNELPIPPQCADSSRDR